MPTKKPEPEKAETKSAAKPEVKSATPVQHPAPKPIPSPIPTEQPKPAAHVPETPHVPAHPTPHVMFSEPKPVHPPVFHQPESHPVPPPAVAPSNIGGISKPSPSPDADAPIVKPIPVVVVETTATGGSDVPVLSPEVIPPPEARVTTYDLPPIPENGQHWTESEHDAAVTAYEAALRVGHPDAGRMRAVIGLFKHPARAMHTNRIEI